jgi:hypothetical protein
LEGVSVVVMACSGMSHYFPVRAAPQGRPGRRCSAIDQGM